jgi:small subunit ribosomal protein S11
MGKKKVIEQAGVDLAKVASAEEPARPTGKKSKRIEKGIIFIKASYNNTLVSATDSKGNLIAWVSSGSMGFSGPKKATPFASSKIIAALGEKLKNTGPIDVDVVVRGVGGGRDSALRSLLNHGFNIISIKDVTPIPHNGPKPPKPRRV